jgi:hypothetical protein
MFAVEVVAGASVAVVSLWCIRGYDVFFNWVTSQEAPSQHTWANDERLMNADGRQRKVRGSDTPDHERTRQSVPWMLRF